VAKARTTHQAIEWLCRAGTGGGDDNHAAHKRGRSAAMGGLTMERVVMGQMAKEEDQWLRRATDAAIAGARKIALETVPVDVPVGRLTDAQWGWIISAAIFGWCRTKVEQGIEEGLDGEQTLLETGVSPSPCDDAVVHSILPALADCGGIDWSLPLAAWPKGQIVNFLLMVWQLIAKAEAVRGQAMGGILKSEDWSTKGDAIPF
jgi:hypothetical protein